ncbi:hypothetical protein [Spartinivicinus ruber]|uniref:hypothetical protein n=1 Tax=Spartinivicinus ruber TaxID=2683272 RepID=UPI0013D00059|nr:hypothetical protein [Spartinivicinus ruber]
MNKPKPAWGTMGFLKSINAEAKTIVQNRCSMCHARTPSWPGIHRAPGGVMLETMTDMQHWAPAINKVVVLSRAMPPGNITGISHEERALLGQWMMVSADNMTAVASK